MVCSTKILKVWKITTNDNEEESNLFYRKSVMYALKFKKWQMYNVFFK